MSVTSPPRFDINPNTLELQIEKLRRQKIDWPVVMVAHEIIPTDLKILLEFDNGHQDTRVKIVAEYRNELARVLLVLLERAMNVGTIQRVLLLIDEMLDVDHERVMSTTLTSKILPLTGPFLKNLGSKDDFTVYISARIFAKIITWSSFSLDRNDLKFYVTWLRDRLSIIENQYMHTVATCLQLVLRVDACRNVFVSLDGISRILKALQAAKNFQIEYQLIFCIWVISYNPEIADRMTIFRTIPILADVFTDSEKEKVIRVVLAVFRNFVLIPQDQNLIKENCINMVQHKVLKQLTVLEQRRLEDEDVIEDIKFLSGKLQASVQDLSSFEVYTSELKSGRLEWSPVHRSAQFWRENAGRLNESKYELLRLLLNLLETTQDPLILAVASYDIGEYVRYYPRGKEIVESLGGKQVIMQLLSHDDRSVRYEALLALQKIMVQNWGILGRQIEKDQNLPAVLSK